MAKIKIGNVKGKPGDKGNGIKSISQTTTSTEDSGINKITVTMDDGTTKEFTFRNGSQGSSGSDGISPHVGANGNWFLGDVDTTVPAQGSIDISKLRGNDTSFTYPKYEEIDANNIKYEFHGFILNGTNLPEYHDGLIYKNGNGFLDVEIFNGSGYKTGLLNRTTHVVIQTFRYPITDVMYNRRGVITYKSSGEVAEEDWTEWVRYIRPSDLSRYARSFHDSLTRTLNTTVGSTLEVGFDSDVCGSRLIRLTVKNWNSDYIVLSAPVYIQSSGTENAIATAPIITFKGYYTKGGGSAGDNVEEALKCRVLFTSEHEYLTFSYISHTDQLATTADGIEIINVKVI